MSQPTILLADNDETFLQIASEFIERNGYKVICVTNSANARSVLERIPVALAILDYRLEKDEDERDKSGLSLARTTIDLRVPKIILTKFDRSDYAVESLRPDKGEAAAADFVVKQSGLEKLLEAINRVLVRSQVFLCYAKPDREEVMSLYNSLIQAGFAPWMDKKHLQGGERWQTMIRKAIRASDFFVVCISKRSVNRRGFMQREIRLALEIWDEKLEDDIYIIPVRLEDCEITHERLVELQWVDLFRPGGFSQLVHAIRTGTKRRFQHS